jgi:p-aminobenzoyl-glutamate transporter AbgT
METWMMIQAAAGLGALLCLAGAMMAWKRGKKPVAVVAVVLAGVCGFLVANATAFVTTDAEAEIEAQIDDFDAPL